MTTRCPIPAWVLIGASWVWFLFALIYFTDVACPFNVFLVLGGSGLGLGVVWLVLTAVWPHLIRHSVCAVWLTVPAAGLLGSALLLTSWGLLVRVALSETTLRKCAANAAAAGGVPDEFPEMVGLFWVEDVRVDGGGVYFYTSRSFLNRHGVAYLPPGSASVPRISVCHLYGSWYSFEWRF